MTKIAHSITINAPLEKVFEYASDWKNWEEWFEGVSDFESISKIQKGNGSRYRYKARMMMFNYKIEAEIRDFIENKGFRGIGIKGMPYESYWSFEEVNGKTKFTYGLEYSFSIPVIGNLLDSWFVVPQWNKIIKNSLENLKQKFTE